jgi:hypothetical protein
MFKLTEAELIADYNAHVDAVVQSVRLKNAQLYSKALCAELDLFIERYPHIPALARK